MTDAKRRADPAGPDFRLANWPFYHMNLAIRSYDGEMRRLLRSSRIDMPRWRILMIVHEREPVSVSAVADEAIMEMSTVTRAIQRLRDEGLIEVATRASDQRVSEAVLTADGRAATERVMRAASRVFHQAFASFDADEVALLIRLLSRVHGNLRNPV